jgi:hypothetical protein
VNWQGALDAILSKVFVKILILVFECLGSAIHSMTAAPTIIFSAIEGGIWPQIVQPIMAAPALQYPVIEHSPWLGYGRDVITLPRALRLWWYM